MITKSGLIIPNIDKQRVFKATQAITIGSDGKTTCHCAVCQDVTTLTHESMLLIGHTQKESISGKFVGVNWIESSKIHSVPIMRRFWVCPNCHSSRVGQPLIPIRKPGVYHMRIEHKLITREARPLFASTKWIKSGN